MDMKELSKHSGHSTSEYYKTILMKQIALCREPYTSKETIVLPIIYNNINTIKKAKFRLYTNELYPDKYCDINIIINAQIYDKHKMNDKLGETYYYITYYYIYGSHEGSIQEHPFWDNKTLYNHHSNGEIIVKNEVNDKLIKYLMMNMDKLGTVSGKLKPIQYKKRVMHQIALAWD
jgi:hypothetical protein